MRRTPAEARQWLENEAKNLNPEAFRQYDAEVKKAEAEIRQRATAHVESVYTDNVARARQVSEGFCDVRDTARRLTEQINTGRISTADAAAELQRLRATSRAQRTSHDQLAQVADRMDSIEGDPAAWHANLAAKFPHMQPDFSF